MKLVTDECVFKTTLELLRKSGFDCIDLREIGLSGAKDHEVIELAKREKRILFTFDRHFANTLRFPIGSNPGIILVRVDPLIPLNVNALVADFFKKVKLKEVEKALTIIEQARYRIRKK